MQTAPRAGEVHLWRAPLDVSPQLVASFAATLSDAELDRADRRRRAKERARSITGRGWLRHVVASYLDVHPAAVAFEPGAHGKPRLTHPAAPWLRFNLSHSGTIVVFAVARDREVGVDVEEIRDDVDIAGVSQRVFTVGQCRELAALSPAERHPAFYAMWTRNEAYLKATGTGFGGADRDVDHPPGWLLTEFDAGPGYAAAVAVEGTTVEVPPVANDIPID